MLDENDGCLAALVALCGRGWVMFLIRFSGCEFQRG